LHRYAEEAFAAAGECTSLTSFFTSKAGTYHLLTLAHVFKSHLKLS
jgi:hypothetical protein